MKSRKNDLIRYVMSLALVGAYVQCHYIFIRKQHAGIFGDIAMGLLAGALAGMILYRVSDSRIATSAKAYLVHGAYALCMAGAVYAGYVLYKNSEPLMYYGRTTSFCVKLLFFFLIPAGAASFFRKQGRMSFEFVSVILFCLAAIYLAFLYSLISGLILAGLYLIYLCFLGRFFVKLINKWLGLLDESGLETVMVSFIYGILANYVAWYVLGMSGCLHPSVSMATIGLVLLVGAIYFRDDARYLYYRARDTLAFSAVRRFRYPHSLFFNIILFCLLFILMALACRIPGHEDSSQRMYMASLFRFRELGRIELLPFYDNWPLIFQPLMMEITGLPLFLTGGLPATRIFYAFCFFSFIPFLVLLTERNKLPRQTIVLFVFVFIASSFTFRMSYCDKPEVMAFPALVSLFAVCVLMLKEVRPWYLLSLGPLCAIVYNTKLILIAGALFALVGLILFNSSSHSTQQDRSVRRKAAAFSLLIFIVICLINPIQNIVLRGNPFHPFAGKIFASSHNFPEEVHYTTAPKTFFKMSMPVESPSSISGINMDEDKGLYGPLLPVLKEKYKKTADWWYTQYTINIVTVLVTVLLPVILLAFRSNSLALCGFTGFMSFLVWFCWVGDGLRYSAYFPGISLLTALMLNNSPWPRAWMNVSWRHTIFALLLFSIPLSTFSSVANDIPRDIQRYPLHGGDVSAHLQPYSHPVRDYLNAFRSQRPILLVSDMVVTQYGFFQPNFRFLPIYMNMMSLSAIKPSHFLTPLPFDKNTLTTTYPKLLSYLTHEKDFFVNEAPLHLYRFKASTPWDDLRYTNSYKERYAPVLIQNIERFRNRYLGMFKKK